MKSAWFFWFLISLPSLCSAAEFKDAAAMSQTGEEVELYIESGIHHSGRSVAFSSDEALIAAGSIDLTIKVWDAVSGRELETLPSNHQVFSLAFVPDRPALIASNDDGTVVLWDLIKREAVWTVKCSDHSFPTIAVDASAFRLRCADWGTATVRQWELKTRSPLAPIPIHRDAVPGTTWTLIGNGSLMTFHDSQDVTKVVDVATSETVGRFSSGKTRFDSSAAYHQGTAKLAVVDDFNSFTLWSWPGPGAEAVLVQPISAPGIHAIAFSPDGSRIAYAAESGDVVILDASRLNEIGRLRSYANRVENAGIVPQSSILSVQVWYNTRFAIDLRNGSFSQNKVPAPSYNEFFDAAELFGREFKINKFEDHINITNIGGKTISTIILLDKLNAWVVIDPDGRFDTSLDLSSVQGVHWVLNGDALHPLPLELLMRDYFSPKLLPHILAAFNFAHLRPLAELNRVQPEVRIAKVERGGSADEALVTVEVSGKKDATQKNDKTATAAYDLRLFRNGQIVGQWPEPKGGMAGAEDIGQWKIESLVPGTENEGKATHTFGVKLAARDKGQPVRFTAYAFNEDRVKSETASNDNEVYKVPDDVAPAKPRAYVIAIGVNDYENSKWKLGFAVKDALDLSGALRSIEGYEVVSVPLVSGEKDGAKLDEATKQDIADTFALLGGHEEHRDRLRQALGRDGSVVDQLRKATPDDLVILGFSGHGWADKQGRFYLLPSNSGKQDLSEDETKNATILPKLVSSDELSQWLKDVDAGELAMIIDACHSAASVDQPGFKPGPMGDRGLGQLAYDKGMRILAATQADNVALESEKLGQGLLTYALVDEGLKDHKAAPDGKGPITIGTWLHYAEQRVPQLYDDIQGGRIQAAKVVVANDAARSVTKEPIIEPAFRDQIVQHAQTPQLFDFYKQQNDPAVGATR
jgi:uncharacterized caspase-like protein